MKVGAGQDYIVSISQPLATIKMTQSQKNRVMIRPNISPPGKMVLLLTPEIVM